jgi:hypothetical protein
MTCGLPLVRDAAGIFGEGHVPDPVQAVFDLPVSVQQCCQPGRIGLPGWQAGDRIDQLGPGASAGQVGGVPLGDDDLFGVWGKCRSGGRADQGGAEVTS